MAGSLPEVKCIGLLQLAVPGCVTVPSLSALNGTPKANAFTDPFLTSEQSCDLCPFWLTPCVFGKQERADSTIREVGP